MSLKKTFAKTLLVTTIASLLTACGGSDKSTPIVEKTPVVDETLVVEDSPLYLVKTTDWSTDDGTTLLFLTDSLNSDTKFNAEDALAISGYHYVAVNESGDDEDSAFYLAVDNTPTLQRYVVNDEGKVELDKELDFSAQGITDARNAMRAGKIFSADKGYFIDQVTMQVVVFNPTEMTFTTTIDLSEYAEVDYPNRWAIFPVIDGDRVVIPITFYGSDWSAAALSKLVIIDTTTDTVTVDSSTLCGSVSGSAVDAAGNVYWATSADVAVSYKLDPVNAAFAPCMIRMKSGAEGWDDGYYVNMTDLTDNDRPAYGVTTGDGYKGYTLVYSDEATPLTAENARGAAKQSVWEFSSFDLEAPFAGVTKVENALPTNNRLNYGVFLNDDKVTSWVDTVSSDYTVSTIYDTTDSESWKVLIVVPGDLETISRIR
jgi:hypothetical protein